MTKMTGPRHHHHSTIHTEWHKLYSADPFTRIDATYAEQEAVMRECMSNRENYDLEMVRRVVAKWAYVCPGCNCHRVALEILREREAELLEATKAIARPARERYRAKLDLCLRNAREARRASWQEHALHRETYRMLSREAMVDARVWRGLLALAE